MDYSIMELENTWDFDSLKNRVLYAIKLKGTESYFNYEYYLSYGINGSINPSLYLSTESAQNIISNFLNNYYEVVIYKN